MEYITRMVRSTEGLSQEDALTSLQSHPSFKSGTKIASVYNQGGRWVAKLLEPKTAAAFEDITETPEELHEKKHESLGLDDHEESESPLEELEEHEDDNFDNKKIAELEKKIDLLLEALGISEDGEDMDSLDELEGPQEPMADLPPVPEKHDPSASGSGSGAKLKPGEVPNKPGVTPVGSPSFASVRQAVISTPPNAAEALPASSPSESSPTQAACQKCGGSDPQCTQCSGAKMTSFTASKLDPNREMTIRQAKASLENHYSQFRVARIKRDGNAIHAHMERTAGPRWDAFKDKAKRKVEDIGYSVATGDWQRDPNTESTPMRNPQRYQEEMINPRYQAPEAPAPATCDKCNSELNQDGSCSGLCDLQ